MSRGLILSLCLLAAAPAARAGLQGGQQTGGDLFSLIDREGNLVTVANRMDGAASVVQLTSFNRYSGVNWDRTHADGFIERVTTTYPDPRGGILAAGVRLWEGVTYLWVMKYSPMGQLLWEKADTAPGCTAFAVVGDEEGEVWVAGSCLEAGRTPARLLHFSESGNLLWSQSHDEGGRSYVRGLNLDFSGRATVSLEILGGGYGGSYARAVVFNRNGGRVTVY